MLSKTNSVVKSFVAFILSVTIIVFVCLIVAFPVMWLWNWLVPSILGLRAITWVEALGLSVLTHMLFATAASKS